MTDSSLDWPSRTTVKVLVDMAMQGLTSDEMSPLYETRCLTVGLVQMRLRQSPADC
jgi:hypothetical protein